MAPVLSPAPVLKESQLQSCWAVAVGQTSLREEATEGQSLSLHLHTLL